MQLGDAAAAYITAPGSAALHSLRTAVQADPTYSASGNHVAEATALLEAGDLDEAEACLSFFRKGGFFNPSTHRLLARVMRAKGREDIAQLEEQLEFFAIKSLLDSGDGTRTRPYVVLRVADEYDVLDLLGRSLERQAVVTEGGRLFDLIECTDGSEVWFELFRAGERVAS